MKNILHIEDDQGLVRVVGDFLKANGYSVSAISDGKRGLEFVLKGESDLILLDLMLPGASGFDILRELRSRGVTAPIIITSAKFQLSDKVSGLRLGADDYIVKPFEFEELIARMEAALRRDTMPGAKVKDGDSWLDFEHAPVIFGENELRFNSCELLHKGKHIPLSNIEFRLLAYFVLNEGKVVPVDDILRDVWKYEESISTRTLYVHVGWVRKKIGDNDSGNPHIVNIRGVGYRFLGTPKAS